MRKEPLACLSWAGGNGKIYCFLSEIFSTWDDPVQVEKSFELETWEVLRESSNASQAEDWERELCPLGEELPEGIRIEVIRGCLNASSSARMSRVERTAQGNDMAAAFLVAAMFILKNRDEHYPANKIFPMAMLSWTSEEIRKAAEPLKALGFEVGVDR